ncbi:N-acetylmuramoyl-L-alanine amidase [Caloramator sp. ALD01]|uniref:N-acetylmuramoyl-L-alanine amidase n=1 Tax=Caloramator sp. ALD01 TaxID=1031288 RepID=UPI00041FE144|nr:N-acetylmuramoyl-L-alanine amidase [Caloramator sp. ALD01]
MKICIDAGHGGKDAGAVGKYKEKDLNLKVALKLGELLKNSGQDVIFTRATDVFVELSDRAKTSNNAGADLFVSIHQNGAENKTARGVETFSNVGSTKGKVLAQNVQNELIKLQYTTNRGVKEAEFYVIKYTKCPAILVECGFVTNEQDAEFVAKNIDKIASAIAKGIGKYLGFEVVERKVPDWPIMKMGHIGEYVKQLQTRLNELGYNLAVDGSFGPATDRAVRDFQKKKGLVVDGYVGPATRKALFS